MIDNHNEKHPIPGHSEISNLTYSIKKTHLFGPPPRRADSCKSLDHLTTSWHNCSHQYWHGGEEMPHLDFTFYYALSQQTQEYQPGQLLLLITGVLLFWGCSYLEERDSDKDIRYCSKIQNSKHFYYQLFSTIKETRGLGRHYLNDKVSHGTFNTQISGYHRGCKYNAR